jgi:dsRNA-specific ribonuclease
MLSSFLFLQGKNTKFVMEAEQIPFSVQYPDVFARPPATRAQIEAILHPWIPRDLTLYWAAFTHPSVHSILPEYTDRVHPWYRTGHRVFGLNYEKLEFLGDSVIHLSLAAILIRMYPTKNEGFLSRVRINIERKTGLSELARRLGLEGLIKGHPELKTSDAVLENVFEGFIGAFFEDQQIHIYNGLQCCHEFLLRTLRARFANINDMRVDDNYKDTVLRLFDRKVFESIDFSYSYENRTHIVTLTCSYVPRRIEYVQTNSYTQSDLAAIMISIPVLGVTATRTHGRGRNKPEAEQLACKELMEKFHIRMLQL